MPSLTDTVKFSAAAAPAAGQRRLGGGGPARDHRGARRSEPRPDLGRAAARRAGGAGARADRARPDPAGGGGGRAAWGRVVACRGHAGVHGLQEALTAAAAWQQRTGTGGT